MDICPTEPWCRGKDGKPLLAIPHGRWSAYFAASVMDGHAVAVRALEGERAKGAIIPYHILWKIKRVAHFWFQNRNTARVGGGGGINPNTPGGLKKGRAQNAGG